MERYEGEFRCRKRNDKPIDDFFCCMLCTESPEYQAICWFYNLVLVNGKWISRWGDSPALTKKDVIYAVELS